MKFNPFQRKSSSPSNEKLLKAIVAMASQPTPKTQRAFYVELLSSTLLLAEDPDDSPSPILFVDDESDNIILPVFTDAERLKRVCPDALRYSAIPVVQLCQLALQNDIHTININPEQGPGGYLSRNEIEALANNRVPDTSTTDDTFLSKEPTLIPMGDAKLPSADTLDKIVDTTTSFLKQELSIHAGYIIMVRSDDGSSVLTIALHFEAPTNQDKKVDFTRRLVSSLETTFGRAIGVVWLEGKHLENVRSHVTPFYKR